jgi:hypothetical protein
MQEPPEGATKDAVVRQRTLASSGTSDKEHVDTRVCTHLRVGHIQRLRRDGLRR